MDIKFRTTVKGALGLVEKIISLTHKVPLMTEQYVVD